MEIFGRVKAERHKSCLNIVSHKKDIFGYGRISVNRVNTPAHRYVYKLIKGKIPKGLLVRHTCDNPSCVNPEHLILGTIQDNMKDRNERGRTSKAARTLGIINGMCKLTESQVIAIRSLRGKMPQTKIAAKFNISQTQVSGIQTGKFWNHIGGAI